MCFGSVRLPFINDLLLSISLWFVNIRSNGIITWRIYGDMCNVTFVFCLQCATHLYVQCPIYFSITFVEYRKHIIMVSTWWTNKLNWIHMIRTCSRSRRQIDVFSHTFECHLLIHRNGQQPITKISKNS